MKRMKSATLTAATVLSCTLAFSGCSLIGQVVPSDQGGTAGEQADADGQEQSTDEGESAQDSRADAPTSDAGSSSSDDGGSGSASEASGTDDGTTGSDSGSTGTDEGQTSGGTAEVSIGESFEDPEMEDKIEVVSAVRNFDTKERETAIDLGGEAVLLEVKITPGQKYGGLIQKGAFKISDGGGAGFEYNETSSLKDEMKAAGFEPLADVSRRDGGTHQGWIAFIPDEEKDTYKIRYERAAGKVLGTDEKVPGFEKTVDIPAA